MLSKSAIAFKVNTPFLKYKNRKHFDVEEQFGYFHIPSQKNVPGFHKSRSSFMVSMFSVGIRVAEPFRFTTQIALHQVALDIHGTPTPPPLTWLNAKSKTFTDLKCPVSVIAYCR